MKRGPYKKPEKDRKAKLKRLNEVIKGCRDIPIATLLEKLEISRATYYRSYHSKAIELRKHYSKIALF